MSGIVGIVNPDGEPVDGQLLRRMTDFMAFRGPDAQGIWSKGGVGFGHTLLRTTDESANESQPFSFDENVRIIADARIDAREDLVRRLETEGRAASLDAPDVELILHAYLAWGEDCVEHLLGDFAFAVWDERRRRLFCARDHFGMKPFFYAAVGDGLVFGNTLNCLRLYPGSSDEVDESFIGDFLLFGASQDQAATIFAGIKRLPPGHSLTWSSDGLRVRRYWSLPDYELVYRARPSDYVEQFTDLLRRAVADRLRTSRVGLELSGGLDSTTVAAVAHGQLSQKYASFDLRAYTSIFKKLFDDDEGHYAQLVGDAYGIPITYDVGDDREIFAHWERRTVLPEPLNEPNLGALLAWLEKVVDKSRVMLTGMDGDTVLREWSRAYYHWLFQRFRWGELLSGMWWYATTKRQLPRIGFRYTLRRLLNKENASELPVWLNREFARRLDLAGRLKENNRPRLNHPLRPKAYDILRSPIWAQVFELYDSGISSAPVEYRHPLADLRLIEFLLTIPPVPWAVEKELLKESMRGVLPDAVLRRPKTPLRVDPVFWQVQNGKAGRLAEIEYAAELERYVDLGKLNPAAGKDSDELWINLRPLGLNHWFASARSASLGSESGGKE